MSAGQTAIDVKTGSTEHMLLEACRKALKGIDRSVIDGVLVSTNDTARYLGPIVSDITGIRTSISHTVESMCSSGGSALASAYAYVRAGIARAVLVAGVEQPNSPGNVLKWDVTRGQFQNPIYWASIITGAYKRRYNVKEHQLAAVSAKNKCAAKDTPEAASSGDFSIKDVLASKKITSQLRLLECSRPCAGSAALVVASAEICNTVGEKPVWISGVGQDSGPVGFGALNKYHRLESVERAAQRAYEVSCTKPADIDVAEIHDAFAVCEPMVLEALSFTPLGTGAKLSGSLYKQGSRRINPRGGLLGCGHPLGATGLYQAIEIFRQLRGEAGTRQVPDARVGLTQGMSAAAASSTVLVMES